MIRRPGRSIRNSAILRAELVVYDEFVDAGVVVREGAGEVFDGEGWWGCMGGCEGEGNGQEGKEGRGCEFHCDRVGMSVVGWFGGLDWVIGTSVALRC